MKEKPSVTLFDMVIILLAVGLTAFSAYTAYVKPQAVSRVLIQGQRRKWSFPLDADETVSVPGPLGTTVVRIHKNSAWVESSPCDNQTCVIQGPLKQQGAWAACLPNGVFLMIEGSDGQGNALDAIAW
ncbi:MAG: NusG domain II-containing protein [Spirochaetaceae bacterium]|jgi:hypothetical protein|nr:NusG domain II-containing protein [Spirochaetaceae bacterium]